jgi:hypothetical protein
VFRGVSFSNGRPALQADATVSRGALYATVFASTVATFSDGQGGESSSEVGLQAGWAPYWAGTQFDLGVVGYDYPGARDVASYGFFLTASRPMGPVDAQIGAWVTPHQSSIRNLRTGDTDDSLYVRARLRAPAVGGWATPMGEASVTGRVGWHQGAGVINLTNATDEYGLDGALTLTLQRGALSASVGLVATDFRSIYARGRDQAGTRAVLGLAWAF